MDIFVSVSKAKGEVWFGSFGLQCVLVRVPGSGFGFRVWGVQGECHEILAASCDVLQGPLGPGV